MNVALMLVGVVLVLLALVSPAIYAAGLLAAGAVFIAGAEIVSELVRLRRLVAERIPKP